MKDGSSRGGDQGFEGGRPDRQAPGQIASGRRLAVIGLFPDNSKGRNLSWWHACSGVRRTCPNRAQITPDKAQKSISHRTLC